MNILIIDAANEKIFLMLIKNKNIYSISMLEDVKDDEYYNRLYFRRRQGWGKSVISQN